MIEQGAAASDKQDAAEASAGQAKQPKRLARRQVDAPVTDQPDSRPPGEVNIWTGRPAKGHGKSFQERQAARRREASKFRCLPKVDEGWTRGEGAGIQYCCLYFARGICHHGSECNYLHRVPTEGMELRHRTDYGHDIFGRERVPEGMDGRKRGVGSYERECRTLYVHYGGAGTLPVAEVRKAVSDDLSEWGPLEDVHIVPLKTIAFVRYKWRSSAEFAKAAMHQQTLRSTSTTEVLDVRWANDDPNPAAVRRVQREREEAFRDAYVRAVNDMDPEAKRARIQQLHLHATTRPGAAAGAYPNTDAQFAASSAGVGAYPNTDGQYAGDAAAGGDIWRVGGGGYGGGSGGYQHTFEGCDAYFYQRQQGGGGGGAQEQQQQQGGEIDWYAFQQAQAAAAHHPNAMGGALGDEDHYSRYLRPQDWESVQAAGAAAGGEGGRSGGRAAGSADAQQHSALDADKAAEEALGMLGSYGSASESGED